MSNELTKENMDDIECEMCGTRLGWACGDLDCLNLRCESCYDQMPREEVKDE